MSEADQQSMLPEDELADAFAQIEALSQNTSQAAETEPARDDPPSAEPDAVATDPPDIPENDIAAALDELAAAAEEIATGTDGAPKPTTDTPQETPDNVTAPADPDREPETAATTLAEPSDDLAAGTDTDDPPPTSDAGEQGAAPDAPELEADADAEPRGEAASNRPPAGDISFSNALVPDDELAAALAEIESLTDDDNIPSLDDDGPGVFTNKSAKLTPDEAQESPAQTDNSGALSGDAELAAALAEIETISTQEKTPGTAAVKTSSAPEAAAPSSKPSPPDGDGETTATAEAGEPAEDGAHSKRIRFKIKKKAGQEGEDPNGYKPPTKGEAPAGDVALPETPLFKRIIRILDRLLDAINRPFARLSEAQRNAIGYAAVATIVMSLLAAVFMPKALPHRDATTFLREKAAQLRAENPSAAAAPAGHRPAKADD